MPAPAVRRQTTLWPWVSLTPLGLGAWAPIYAGAKLRRPLWVLLGLVWTLATIAGWILAISTNGNGGAGGGLIILGWLGAVATSFVLRPRYDEIIASPLQRAIESARDRISDRESARELVKRDPSLAAEVGIGRPDVHGATAGGLVDINNASVTALLKLPGVDGELATRIVETRQQVHGFSSLEDMGMVLELDGDLVEGLRDEAVFLPRRGPA
jgi:hypothetical protein